MASIPPELVSVHRVYNRNSAPCWGEFYAHRGALTAIALEGGGDSLALLGAGNCNDVDLKTLAQRFQEIHLVDVDEESLRRAQQRQGPGVADKLVLHAPIDLSGALGELASFGAKAPTADRITAFPAACTERVLAALPRKFDTVVSTCLLSQLMHSCAVALGTDHPALDMIAWALATAHVRSLVRLVRPGGHGALVSDTATGEMYPLDDRWGKETPVEMLGKLVQGNTVLSGTNPAIIYKMLTEDPMVAPLVETPELVQPWLWHMGQLTLFVYAFTFKRKT
jgi:hypothetical protein